MDYVVVKIMFIAKRSTDDIKVTCNLLSLIIHNFNH